MQAQPDTGSKTREREEHLSSHGRWRSFPNVPHLSQYASNGNYYGRQIVGGKVIRKSLETAVRRTVKLRLTDFLKGQQEACERVAPPKFTAAVALFEGGGTIKPRSVECRRLCLKRIQATLPGI